MPWDFSPETMKRFAPGVYDPEQDPWELYYLPEDFSQANDVAAEHPDKLEELKELFWQEAERNRVLPLMGCMSIFFGSSPRSPRSPDTCSPATSRTSSAGWSRASPDGPTRSKGSS